MVAALHCTVLHCPKPNSKPLNTHNTARFVPSVQELTLLDNPVANNVKNFRYSVCAVLCLRVPT